MQLKGRTRFLLRGFESRQRWMGRTAGENRLKIDSFVPCRPWRSELTVRSPVSVCLHETRRQNTSVVDQRVLGLEHEMHWYVAHWYCLGETRSTNTVAKCRVALTGWETGVHATNCSKHNCMVDQMAEVPQLFPAPHSYIHQPLWFKLQLRLFMISESRM